MLSWWLCQVADINWWVWAESWCHDCDVSKVRAAAPCQTWCQGTAWLSSTQLGWQDTGEIQAQHVQHAAVFVLPHLREATNKSCVCVVSWCGHPDLVINHYLLLSLVSTVPGWLSSSSPQCWWSRSRSWGVLCHFLHSLVEERVPIGTSISLQRKQYRIEFWVMNSVWQVITWKNTNHVWYSVQELLTLRLWKLIRDSSLALQT